MSIFTAMWQAVQACFARCLGRPGGSTSRVAGAGPARELEARGSRGSSKPVVSDWLIFLGGIQTAALVMSARPAGRGWRGTNFICYNCGQGQIYKGSERCPRCGAPLNWAGEFQNRQPEG